MTCRKLSVLVAPTRGVAVAAIAATTLSGLVLPALAQQPAVPPVAPRPVAPRPPAAAAPRPAAPAAQRPAAPAAQRPAAPAAQRPAAPAAQRPAAAAPAPPAVPQAQAAVPPAPPNMPPLIYSPWNKFCINGDPPNPKEACLTGRDARTEEGVFVIAAALIEQEGEQKVLRVTLPVTVLLSYGARIVIDREPALTAPYVFCTANGCMAEFEGTADLVGKLKKGQTLNLQAVNMARNAFTLPLPLSDNTGNSFAKANDGPPTDPKVFEEQQKKLQEELQKRGDEARKKLENQGGAPAR